MSTKKLMKPNRLLEVQNELKESSIEFDAPESIRVDEKSYYHVLAIESKPNEITRKLDFKGRIILIDSTSYEVSKTQLRTLGEIFILHNPTLK